MSSTRERTKCVEKRVRKGVPRGRKCQIGKETPKRRWFKLPTASRTGLTFESGVPKAPVRVSHNRRRLMSDEGGGERDPMRKRWTAQATRSQPPPSGLKHGSSVSRPWHRGTKTVTDRIMVNENWTSIVPNLVPELSTVWNCWPCWNCVRTETRAPCAPPSHAVFFVFLFFSRIHAGP